MDTPITRKSLIERGFEQVDGAPEGCLAYLTEAPFVVIEYRPIYKDKDLPCTWDIYEGKYFRVTPSCLVPQTMQQLNTLISLIEDIQFVKEQAHDQIQEAKAGGAEEGRGTGPSPAG